MTPILGKARIQEVSGDVSETEQQLVVEKAGTLAQAGDTLAVKVLQIDADPPYSLVFLRPGGNEADVQEVQGDDDEAHINLVFDSTNVPGFTVGQEYDTVSIADGLIIIVPERGE